MLYGSKSVCATLMSQALCCPTGRATQQILSAFLQSEDLGSNPRSATSCPGRVTPLPHLPHLWETLHSKPPRGMKRLDAQWVQNSPCRVTLHHMSLCTPAALQGCGREGTALRRLPA